MTINLNKNSFLTFDLGLVAALISTGFQLQDLNKSNSKKVQFVFTESDDIKQAAEDYFSCNFQVDAQTYWNSVKALKSRMYSS